MNKGKELKDESFDLLENALSSIQVGVEDYQSKDRHRSISAVRNFYAGVLLLGKQCLINAVPDADPMDVLGTRYEPIPDGKGGIEFRSLGERTIDFSDLKDRFKKFDLVWPNVGIEKLQKIRNKFEHFHTSESVEQIQEIIADCFPLVEHFFTILKVNPADKLGDSWKIMLEEKRFFQTKKKECDDTFIDLAWKNFDPSELQCSACDSSLLYQKDAENSDPTCIKAGCKACGKTFSDKVFVKLVVSSIFGADDFVSHKDTGDGIIKHCPECGYRTYVENGEVNQCYYCLYEIEGECSGCGAVLSAGNLSADDSSVCSYCDYVFSKDD